MQYELPSVSLVRITAKTEKIGKNIEFRTNRDNSYSGRHNFICNMGEDLVGGDEIRLTFSSPGTYRFDNVALVAQPLDSLSDMTQALSRDTLENVVIADNSISGEIDLEQRKMLCLSVPYSEGWTAYVNGEKTKLQAVNTYIEHLGLKLGFLYHF